MKLVLRINCTDNCTYGYDLFEPVEYESPEAFLVDFEEWAKENQNKTSIYVHDGFNGTSLDASVEDWGIMTIDEWFENYR